MTNVNALKYPIGRFVEQTEYTQSEINKNLEQFAQVPDQIKTLLATVSPDQFENTYREGGWNVRQLTNHLVDSHINSYIRFKLASTEDTPIVKPYSENEWAKTADYHHISPDDCILTLSHIHQRVIALASDWNEEDWNKTFYHPGRKQLMTLAQNIALYSWHSRHHLQHIKIALSKNL